jgi:carbonic anhydrase/acetyltransferase-like protein (isoleucine patch superfamily)
MDKPLLVALGDAGPAVEGAWVAPSATLVGAVTLGADASIWYATVLRADHERITIGSRSNVQDGCVMHADPDLPVTVGTGVTVGHRAVLHGCTVEDDSLIGMGAMVLNGAHIGAGSLVAAGSVVLEGTRVPPGSLVAGLPAKVRRPLSEEERDGLRRNADGYVELAARHRESTG